MYFFAGVSVAGYLKHKQPISFHIVGVFDALSTVQLSEKYENVLKYMCWNDTYMILGLEDQRVGN